MGLSVHTCCVSEQLNDGEHCTCFTAAKHHLKKLKGITVAENCNDVSCRKCSN